MKNIHLIPTDKPSRVRINPKGKLILSSIPIGSKGETQNIYITNSEEIKMSDYILYNNEVYNWYDNIEESARKIIITTDEDLIADGVQSIDDEFLEWFVKNPSCEEVELIKDVEDSHWRFSFLPYKIIIPKEESKQEISYSEEEVFKLLCSMPNFFNMTIPQQIRARKEWFEKSKK